MNIEYVPNYEALSQSGANVVKACIEKSPRGLFCLATGSSPKGLYHYVSQDPTFDGHGINVLALDEWLGLEHTHPSTCHYYLDQNVFTPWGISTDHQFPFNAQTQAPDAECLRLRNVVDTHGPMKLCLLGLGRNGHLGLNEPGEALQAHAHVAHLDPLSQRHPMLEAEGIRVKHGMTFGLADILQAEKILLLITGKEKRDGLDQFLEGSISTRFPASFLHVHPHVHVIIDESIKD